MRAPSDTHDFDALGGAAGRAATARFKTSDRCRLRRRDVGASRYRCTYNADYESSSSAATDRWRRVTTTAAIIITYVSWHYPPPCESPIKISRVTSLPDACHPSLRPRPPSSLTPTRGLFLLAGFFDADAAAHFSEESSRHVALRNDIC